MDENMDQTIKPINSSSSKTDHLIMLLDKHCKEVEQLALETVAGMDMPFLNPAWELTKGECWQILEKHRDILNIVDQALVLSCLTDYITCASQNELFDTFRKKSDRNALPGLLVRLDSQWVRFFHKLGQYDLTHAQLKSVVYLLRQSLKRLPEAYQKCFFSSALAMGESSLKKVEMPQQWSPVTFSGTVTTHCITSPKETEKITQKQMTSVRKSDSKVQNCSVEHESDARVLTAVAVNKTASKGKQNYCERPTVLRPAASKSAVCTTKHILDFVKLSQKVTAIDQRKSTKGSLNSPVQKTQTKYSSDITKYILKTGKKNPCTEVAQCSMSLNGLLTEGKENQKIWPVPSPAGSNSVTTLKGPVISATPTEKSSVIIDWDSPTKKSKMEGKGKVTNGRVNAFELMMERSRVGTRKNVKRRSLFQ